MAGPDAAPRVLVTGASSGIGRALALAFARRGARVVISARSEARLAEVAGELRAAGAPEVAVVAADLSAPGGGDALAEEIGRRGPAPDGLVNNAGAGIAGPFVENDPARIAAIVRLNVEAPTLLARRLVPAMVGRGHGFVINVASTAAFLPGPGMAVYYATKAYLLSWSEALAEELRGTGVTVTALCPGPTRTDFQRRADMERLRLMRSRALAVMDAEQVARAALAGLDRGRRVVVPGLANRLGALASRLLPRALLARIVAHLNRPA
ncbi:MAG: SDR family oxidoreductase [Acidobacteriota bacterium]